MNEEQMVKILQHYRHDLMNHLQLIQGYLSMKKIDKVESKVQDCLSHYEEERKLMSLNAPSVALWVIQFNSLYDHLRLTYNIHVHNKNYSQIDETLRQQLERIVSLLIKETDKMELIDITLEMSEEKYDSVVEVLLKISAELNNESLKLKLEAMELDYKLNISANSKEITCRFLIP